VHRLPGEETGGGGGDIRGLEAEWETSRAARGAWDGGGAESGRRG
jgi:hypothetical protein